jgi:hypothetical protein
MNLMLAKNRGPSSSKPEMCQSQETTILLLRLMMSVSSFSEGSLMGQELTNASYAPSRTTHFYGSRLELAVQLLHALEQVIVLLLTTVRCTSSVVKTMKIISFVIYGNSILIQRRFVKLNYQKPRTSQLQEVDNAPPFTRVKCSFSEES